MIFLALLVALIGSYDHEVTAMKISYQVTQSVRSQDNGPVGLSADDNAKNRIFAFTIGDFRVTIQPGYSDATYEVPAKIMRCGDFPGSGVVIPAVVSGDRGPHEDFLFLKDSVEYTYTTRQLVAGGVIEKQMPVGATAGQEGRMVLYKGCTTLSDAISGNWTQRLIRPFIITDADLTTRQTGWPTVGSAPTINVTDRVISDTGGDGYFHI